MEQHPLSSTPPGTNDVVSSSGGSAGFPTNRNAEAPSGTPLSRDIDHSQPGSLLPPSARPQVSADGTRPKPIMVSSKLVATSYRGARWFYVICGFSLFNCAAWLVGAQIRFAALEAPDLINSYTSWLGTSVGAHAALMYKVHALVLDALIIAAFAGIGFFAMKGKAWAFLVGGVLLVLDGVTFFRFNDIDPIGLIIHAIALYWIFNGFVATIQLHKQIQAAKSVASSPWIG